MVSNSLLLSFRKVLGYCLHFSSNFHSLRDSAVLPAGVLSSMKCEGGMACTSHTDHGAALTHSASAFRWIWLPAQLRGGESNGTPLQCSCLENPRDGGAWWAAVYGVSQSRTRLKRLSSSSSWEELCLLRHRRASTWNSRVSFSADRSSVSLRLPGFWPQGGQHGAASTPGRLLTTQATRGGKGEENGEVWRGVFVWMTAVLSRSRGIWRGKLGFSSVLCAA